MATRQPWRPAIVRSLLLLLLLLLCCHGALGAEDEEDEGSIDWFALPFPIHSPETGWALTLSALISTSIREGPASSIIATAAWSEHDQRSLAVDTSLNLGMQWRLAGRLAIEDWPTQYFGLGGDTRADDEEFYDARNLELALDLQRASWVLALHQHLESTSGNVPFQEMPRLGDTATPVRLRGHITGRFRDRASAAVQGELRFPLRWRFGGVVFAGVGDVAPTLGALSLSDLKWTGGVGLRFQALRGQRMNLRLDVGVAEDETGVYFSILEAF